MKKSELKQNAYQRLLFNDEALTEEKRMWLSLFDLEEGQDKIRKSFFREIGEIKKENKELKRLIVELQEFREKKDHESDLREMII